MTDGIRDDRFCQESVFSTLNCFRHGGKVNFFWCRNQWMITSAVPTRGAKKPCRQFKGLRPMPPTPSAPGVCISAGCKAAGCKAAGLQAAGLRAAGVKAARVALQAAGLQCRLQGLRYRLQGGPGQFAQRGGNAVLLHFEVQNSSHLSRASPSKEQRQRPNRAQVL